MLGGGGGEAGLGLGVLRGGVFLGVFRLKNYLCPLLVRTKQHQRLLPVETVLIKGYQNGLFVGAL